MANRQLIYRAYGVLLASALPCPELRQGQGSADVLVRFEELPSKLERIEDQGRICQANSRQCLIALPGTARYLVQRGEEIIVDSAPGATEDQVRLYLLGACLGALLSQRGLLVLHAGAIRTEQGAVLFSGESGAGKSTLLNAMIQRGYPMLSDDITAITMDAAGKPIVLPGYPQSKLWADAAAELGRSTKGLRRVYPNHEKYFVPLRDHFWDEPTPLHAIYALGTSADGGADVEIEPIRGGARFNTVLENTYIRRFLDGMGLRRRHFQLASAVGNHARFAQIRRPTDRFLLDTLTDAVARDANL